MIGATAAAATRAVRASGRGVRVSVLASAIGLLAMATALAATTTTVRSTNSPRYGRILENGVRHTLYVWCYGTSSACNRTHTASSWPPFLLNGKLVVAGGSGVNRSKLSTRKLASGKRQVTYYGQPLFQYKGDRKPCQVNGEGRVSGNGSFFVITTSGRAEPEPCYLGSGPGSCPPACGKG